MLDQSTKLLGPSRELNKLALSKLEQLLSLQLASLRDYTDLNMKQLKAAADIASAGDLKDYIGQQKEFLQTVGEKLVADAQALAAVGKEFTEEAQKLTLQGLGTTTKGFR
ncbi:MAG: TIGR01841 family phasin [Xanthobacteraceae bacterium]